MWTDSFVLTDDTGKVLAKKMHVEHIKVFLDEMNPEVGQKFTVKSEVSGYVLEVTKGKTTQEDWREYSYKCELALD